MRPDEQNLAYLRDMREAAKDVVSFVKGVNYTKFARDKVIRYAVERQLMLMDEAANHVLDAFKEKYKEIP